jgi:hypothetical protein
MNTMVQQFLREEIRNVVKELRSEIKKMVLSELKQKSTNPTVRKFPELRGTTNKLLELKIGQSKNFNRPPNIPPAVFCNRQRVAARYVSRKYNVKLKYSELSSNKICITRIA